MWKQAPHDVLDYFSLDYFSDYFKGETPWVLLDVNDQVFLALKSAFLYALPQRWLYYFPCLMQQRITLWAGEFPPRCEAFPVQDRQLVVPTGAKLNAPVVTQGYYLEDAPVAYPWAYWAWSSSERSPLLKWPPQFCTPPRRLYSMHWSPRSGLPSAMHSAATTSSLVTSAFSPTTWSSALSKAETSAPFLRTSKLCHKWNWRSFRGRGCKLQWRISRKLQHRRKIPLIPLTSRDQEMNC